MLIKIALRNIVRNGRRSIITILAITAGLSVLTLSLTLRTGQYTEMINSGVSQLAGHVVIQQHGYQIERDAELFFNDRTAIYTALEQAYPDAVITTRSFVGGLLSSTSGPGFAAAIGIDPEKEKAVSDFYEKMVEGEWLDDDPREIVIGVNMAKSLGVDLGDKLVFNVQVGPEMNSRLYRVKGIFKTGAEEVDAITAYVHHESIEELFLQKDMAHQLALHFDNVDRGSIEAPAIKEMLDRDNLEILDWKEAVPEIVNLVEIDVKSNEFINAILLIIVSLGVLNTVLMSVLERTREFGVMLAIGLRPSRLSRVILLEGFLMGLGGAVLGLIIGGIISYPLVVSGIDMSASMGESTVMEGAVMTTHMYGEYDWGRSIMYAICAVVLAILSAVYPARKIKSMNPVDAMRHH